MTVFEAYTHYMEECARKLYHGGSWKEFQDKLIVSDDFNRLWSNGCTAELTIEERRNIWEGFDWNRSKDMSFHNMEEQEIIEFLDDENIPKRRIRKTII